MESRGAGGLLRFVEFVVSTGKLGFEESPGFSRRREKPPHLEVVRVNSCSLNRVECGAYDLLGCEWDSSCLGVIYEVFDGRKERFDWEIDVVWLIHCVLIVNEIEIDDVGIFFVEMNEDLEGGNIGIIYMSVL